MNGCSTMPDSRVCSQELCPSQFRHGHSSGYSLAGAITSSQGVGLGITIKNK